MRVKRIVSLVLFCGFAFFNFGFAADTKTAPAPAEPPQTSQSPATPSQTSPAAQAAPQNAAPPEFPAVYELADETIDVTAGNLVEKKHRIVKILSPAAVQRFSTLEFPYDAGSEKLTVDQVKVTDSDGKTKTIAPADIKEYAPFEKLSGFTNFKVVGTQLKDLAPGATLEYSITKTVQPWISGEYWDEIFLQEVDPSPIKHEQISLIEKDGKLATVKGYHLRLPDPQTSHSADTVTRTWTFDNLPPFVQELSMPSPVDVVPRLVISSIKSWDVVTDAFQSQVFKAENRTGVEEVYSSIVKSADPRQKLAAIYNYVSQTIRSLPPVIGDLQKMPRPLDYAQIVKNGYGDSRDKAALLEALLTKAGFNPKIAVLSTAGNGVVSQDEVPAPYVFNRAIVKVDLNGQPVWLDPAIENCPIGYLSPEDQGRNALLLGSGQFVETPIYGPSANLRAVNAKAKIAADGGLDETLEVKAVGADALNMRAVLKNMQLAERQQVVASLAGQVAKSPDIQGIAMDAVDNLSAPLAVGVKFQARAYGTTAGDLTFLTLPVNVLDYLGPILMQNGPRTYPFVLGNTVDEIKHLELTLPAGYKVRTLPKAVQVKDTFGSYTASFAISKNKLLFQSRLTLDKIYYTPKEFQDLQNLIARQAKLETSEVVLQKVTPKVSDAP